MSYYLNSGLAHHDLRLDITDVYLFRGEVGTAFVMSVNSSAAGSDTPAAFHPHALYDFCIDLDGDFMEDIVHRVTFGELDQSGRQPIELHRLVGGEARDRAATGSLVAWGSTEAVVSGSDGLMLWAGLAAESFYVEPTVLEAVRRAVRFGRRVELGAWQPRRAVNAFAGTSVYSIVLELPDRALSGLVGPDRQIGFWGQPPWAPMWAAGGPSTAWACRWWNRSSCRPMKSGRATTTAPTRATTGRTLASCRRIWWRASWPPMAPPTTRQRTARPFRGMLLPDVLRYQVGSTASFSFASRNGRGLSDNAPEVMFSLVTNRALSGGLSKRHAAGLPRPRFPYVPPPPSFMDASA